MRSSVGAGVIGIVCEGCAVGETFVDGLDDGLEDGVVVGLFVGLFVR